MLKTRLLTTAIWLPILIAVFIFSDTIFFNICVSILTMIAVYEIFNTLKYFENKTLSYVSILYAGTVSFGEFFTADVKSSILYLYIFLLFIILLRQHKTLKVESVGAAFLFTYFLSVSLGTLVGIRRLPFGQFYIYLAFAIPWISDTLAYAFGRAFGKTKLCPEISFQKTVAGAVAGAFGGVVSLLLFKLIVETFFSLTVINLLPAIFCGFLCSALSEMGDLSASVLKRQCSVKDFGNVFPGHGGVMDRFDSVVFAVPVLYTFLRIFNILI